MLVAGHGEEGFNDDSCVGWDMVIDVGLTFVAAAKFMEEDVVRPEVLRSGVQGTGESVIRA